MREFLQLGLLILSTVGRRYFLTTCPRERVGVVLLVVGMVLERVLPRDGSQVDVYVIFAIAWLYSTGSLLQFVLWAIA